MCRDNYSENGAKQLLRQIRRSWWNFACRRQPIYLKDGNYMLCLTYNEEKQLVDVKTDMLRYANEDGTGMTDAHKQEIQRDWDSLFEFAKPAIEAEQDENI
jgi:hypothetical protein